MEDSTTRREITCDELMLFVINCQENAFRPISAVRARGIAAGRAKGLCPQPGVRSQRLPILGHYHRVGTSLLSMMC